MAKPLKILFAILALGSSAPAADFDRADPRDEKPHEEFSIFGADENPDGDHLTTGQEREYGTNPLNPDTDGDGVPE